VWAVGIVTGVAVAIVIEVVVAFGWAETTERGTVVGVAELASESGGLGE
jgi:hypothetical protein